MDQVKVLIVEDDIFICQDLKGLLEKMDYEVCGVAYNTAQALSLLRDQKPNLILLDINLGQGKDGIDVGEYIQNNYRIPFIFLTSYANKSTIERAKQCYPSGYIVKPFTKKDLYATIEIALFNHSKTIGEPSWNQNDLNVLFETNFTLKEIDILRDIFEGKTNRQLSEKHFITINTVKTHVLRIYDKLGVHSRSEAMAVLRQKLSQHR